MSPDGGDADFTVSASAPITQYVDTNLSSYPTTAGGADNLSNANLAGADLGDANLADADLSDANLKGATFSVANRSATGLRGHATLWIARATALPVEDDAVGTLALLNGVAPLVVHTTQRWSRWNDPRLTIPAVPAS